MSTNKNNIFSPDDWVSQAEAARIRGVSRQAINKLIKSGRIATLRVSGVTFLNKKDILNFKPLNSGRKKRK